MEQTIKQFSQELSSTQSDYGGGSATVLVSLLANSLATMVGNYTSKKTTDQQVTDFLTTLDSQSQILFEMIEQDKENFAPLKAAYKLAKDHPQRKEILEHGLRQAVITPYQLIKNLTIIIDKLEILNQSCSKLLISDIGCSAIYSYAALNASYLNVLVNTNLMSDRQYADELANKVKKLVSEYSDKAIILYQTIKMRLSI